MRKLTGFGVVVIVCLGGSSPTHARADHHAPSNEDLRHVRSMTQPRLSPDGKHVLIQISDATADGGRSHLWLVDVAGGEPRQLTFSRDADKRGESSGAWMPDGSIILFLAHRGDHTQLFRLPMGGGEARAFEVKVVPLVDESTAPDAVPPARTSDEAKGKGTPEPIEADVQRYFVSPDGQTIALVVRDPQTPGEKKQRDAKADALVVGRDQHATRLYFLDPETGKLKRTALAPDVGAVSWAPDSSRLVAICRPMNDEDDIEPATTAWILTAADPEHPTQVTAAPKTIDSAAWSRDGKDIFAMAQSRADAPPGYSDLYRLSVGDGAVSNMSDGFQGTLSSTEPITTADGVLLSAELGTKTTLVRFDGGRPKPVTFETGVAAQVNTNATQSGWVWLGASSDRPTALFHADSLGGAATPLKTPDLVPGDWTPVKSQVVTWKSDAFTIEGLLYLPSEASQGKVPLIVGVHGGPTGAWQDSWIPFTQFLVGQGWAVLRPNPRGSTGYGAAFAAANKDDMGGGDYRDIMAGVNAVIAKHPIDADKLALIGYSYGGEMAAFVEGRTDRFKAIVSGAPVINQFSEYGTERGSWYDRWFYGGHPWEHFESAWRQSALSTVAHAKTPFLLLQGQEDRTDPAGQSEEMYRALRQMGVPVELVEYPREDHGPLAGGMFGNPSTEPWHGFDARQRLVSFIKRGFGEKP
jgi:dipeptidyl aminopeptidase/acylaminoacyl peptidase